MTDEPARTDGPTELAAVDPVWRAAHRLAVAAEDGDLMTMAEVGRGDLRAVLIRLDELRRAVLARPDTASEENRDE